MTIEPDKLNEVLEINSFAGRQRRARSSRRRARRKPLTSRRDRPTLGWLVRPQSRTPLFPQAATDVVNVQTVIGAADSFTPQNAVASERYREQARRPIASLYFLFPLVMVYEVAKIFIGPQTACSGICLLYTSPSPRDATLSRMPSSA